MKRKSKAKLPVSPFGERIGYYKNIRNGGDYQLYVVAPQSPPTCLAGSEILDRFQIADLGDIIFAPHLNEACFYQDSDTPLTHQNLGSTVEMSAAPLPIGNQAWSSLALRRC
jgi:hypothetical protein